MKNNKTHKKRRHFVTLIEMMIVMFLIALITGVVAYNYRGTLEEGKAFKTKTGIEKLETILSLTLAENPSADLSGEGWKQYVAHSPLVQNAQALLKDGWGEDYTVNFNPETNQIQVHSEKYEAYRRKNQQSLFRE
jgi:hypothetical protein